MAESMSITQLVGEIVKCLIDNPEAVKIEESAGDRTVIIQIRVDKADIGKVIGKSGRIISSMRTICENIAAKNDKRVSIHIID